MALEWIREDAPRWDQDKARIIGGAPTGIFDSRYRELEAGSRVPGEWWHATEDGRILGYGWLDVVWGDAEILLAVDIEAQGKGVGSFILASLENEARTRGLGYLNNSIRATHPRAAQLRRWLEAREFVASEDGRLMRGVVRRKS